MTRIPIQDISLGDFSAELDQRLHEYFLEETPSYKSAISFDDNRYILLGRTGSGKSAILSHIRERFGSNKDYLCVLIKPDEHYLDIIVRTNQFNYLKKAGDIRGLLYKLVWHYTIIASILEEKYGDAGPRKKMQLLMGNDLKAYNFLEKLGKVSRENLTFTDRIFQVIDIISVDIKFVKLKNKEENKQIDQELLELVKDVQVFRGNYLKDILEGQKIYLLFDDLYPFRG